MDKNSILISLSESDKTKFGTQDFGTRFQNPPAGWSTIGDAQSVVLFEGTYMQANCCKTQAALLDASTLTWTPTGSNKFDVNDEQLETLDGDAFCAFRKYAANGLWCV